MTEILDALKSIVEGLEMQTKSDQIKWFTEQQMAAAFKEHSWRSNKDEKLELTLFHTLDKHTTIEYHCYLRHNHQVYNSYLCINNGDLQDGRIVTNSNSTPELQPLEDLLYDK